ncbi:UNVERIFIED_CONTAM: Outer envelope pore protein 37, chloroplastic [Sesamum angustifolium]|uniref:Outer envelope pore protein 37, chloroplastic n=1 Tax=Sesamum angustifolium TaxID=2727405 RepID=A0AAW2PV02_9LAMI
MAEAKSQLQPVAAADASGGRFGGFFQVGRPKVRVTSDKGEVSEPQVTFTTKFFSLHYDVEENDALLKTSFEIMPGFQFKAAQQVKAQQGEVAMVADLAGPAYKFELSSTLPSIGMPRATFKFPLGEVSLEEKEEEEEERKRTLSMSGILRSHVLNGVCTAQYNEEKLDLRYAFKDEQMTFIPSISLPSNAFSCAFKRRFNPSDKLSYCYYFDSNNWSVVYKHTVAKDYKLKAGYDSQVRLGWASLWTRDLGLPHASDSALIERSGAVLVSEYRPVPDVDYLQELLAIQQQGPRAIGFFGTRNMGFMHQELIEILSYALVITKNHIFTSGASGTNAAVIRGALRAEKPELLTVILPQSLKKQPPESQELLSKVKNVIEKPYNDHLPLIEASRLCNMDIISQVQQVICFAFHDSRLIMETCQEAKNMRKIVTLFYLD